MGALRWKESEVGLFLLTLTHPTTHTPPRHVGCGSLQRRLVAAAAVVVVVMVVMMRGWYLSGRGVCLWGTQRGDQRGGGGKEGGGVSFKSSISLLHSLLLSLSPAPHPPPSFLSPQSSGECFIG